MKVLQKKYNINKLVFFEIYNDPENAILREKQLKAGSRVKKIKLVTELIQRGKTFTVIYKSVIIKNAPFSDCELSF